VEGIAQPILLAAVPSQKLPQTQTVEFEVITLDANAQVTDRSRHQAECWSEALAPETSLEMVQIPGGTFLMGSSEEACTTPPHTVTVPSFSMGQYPVTQAQWRVVAALPPVERPLNPDPSHFSGDRHPVEQVSWLEAVEFCQRLSKMTGRAYRLPTEAEWEYACRAGTTTRFHFGDTIRPHLANYNAGNLATFMISFLRGSTTEIGHFQVANRFGLYDMHGNVWEWCLDTWHDTYEGTPVDGSAWIDATASSHVVRGGSWDFNPAGCRSAFRLKHATDAHYDFLGFRIVC
jgi:formylglycine-generating enzyme required for sulfatase activity